MLATPTVASISINAASKHGEPLVVELEIGTPYRCASGEWACPLALGGLHDRLPDAHGADSFQALCMAIALAQDLLQGFRENGGRLFIEGEDFPLEAYAFGPAIRRQP